MRIGYNINAYWVFGLMFALSIITACDTDLRKSLDIAGDNRGEMEKVLSHFKDDPDPLKYEAAKFLISEMPYHYSYSGDAVELYDSAYLEMANYPYEKRDSVFACLSSNIDFLKTILTPDIISLKADYLIKAIEDACNVWENTGWHTQYDKSYFFDYVLPYRLTHEQPTDWRTAISYIYPFLASNYVFSRRGQFYEAEDGDLDACETVSYDRASKGKVVLLDKENSKASLIIHAPLASSKKIWLTYASVSKDPRIRIFVNGKDIGVFRLQSTISLESLRDSRFGIEVCITAGNNTIAIVREKGNILLDRITVSAMEKLDFENQEDYTESLFRIKNHGTGNYIVFDTIRQSLLDLVKLKPLMNKGDSCGMLRLDFKGDYCWSISSFKKDTTDLCLESRYCSTEENAQVSQYHFQGGNHQKWIFNPIDNHLYKIMNKDNGLYLESAKDDNGNEIMVQTMFADRETQKWAMEKCGKNPSPNPHYPFGSSISAAMKVHELTPEYEWMAFKGSLTPKITSILEGKTGNCLMETCFTVSLCRSIGIPAAIDFTPNYANRSKGHTWCVLINPDGRSSLFHMGFAPGDSVYYVKNYIRPKVYRHRFRLNRKIAKDLSKEQEIPELFIHADFVDVTDEYGEVSDLIRTVPSDIKGEVAYICVFDNKNWVPVDYAAISKGKVKFRKMGRNVMYMAATYVDGKIVPFGNPFLIDSDGNSHDIVANEQHPEKMTILRKYPFMSFNDEFNRRMDGGEFQAANDPEFKSNVTLFTHSGLTDGNWYDIPVVDSGSYRYVRYIGADGSYCNINEVEFFSPDHKMLQGAIIGTEGIAGKRKENVFDGDILTGFEGNSSDRHWVGMKFCKRERISQIRYIPRTDGNCIEIGDRYELKYWHNGKWQSIGEKIATDNRLVYYDVPTDGLYLVSNLSKGQEERIFTYKDGKQIWW